MQPDAGYGIVWVWTGALSPWHVVFCSLTRLLHDARQSDLLLSLQQAWSIRVLGSGDISGLRTSGGGGRESLVFVRVA